MGAAPNDIKQTSIGQAPNFDRPTYIYSMSLVSARLGYSAALNASASCSRGISTSSARHASKVIAAAAKAAKRAKAKDAANSEAMTLQDAVAVLRAVEIAAPASAYELTVTTKFIRGQTVPRGKISLPRDARASAETVLVFATGKSANAARAAGAHHVGGEELIPDLLSSKLTPTKVICTPTLLPIVQKQLARFLGPKGLMPSEKRGTVTTNVASAVKLAQGTMNWKGDRLGVIRAPVARVSWPLEDVTNNVKAFMEAVKLGTSPGSAEPTVVVKKKASSVLQVFLSSRQGPGIRLLDA
ncbi:mitochondrial 54S ribosomal protein mrpl1 [Tulasnella sp. JGI-2019a]|nr:mitochondrial 54S ribosomal protein mrpl1 [Tulasnella sp. JGI-2019a]